MIRILVADDELTIRELLYAVLSDEGYDVLLASNGMQALDLIEREQPDLVLLDIMMPVLDGREAINRLMDLGAANLPPVIVMSAGTKYVPDGDVVSAFLPKPFDIDTVLTAILERVGPASGG
jgi:CheY-like chemotaxis protein